MRSYLLAAALLTVASCGTGDVAPPAQGTERARPAVHVGTFEGREDTNTRSFRISNREWLVRLSAPTIRDRGSQRTAGFARVTVFSEAGVPVASTGADPGQTTETVVRSEPGTFYLSTNVGGVSGWKVEVYDGLP